jgi:uncharacterized protein (DUF1015 family)
MVAPWPLTEPRCRDDGRVVSLLPFRAARPGPLVAQQVCAPPYDVVDRAEAAALAAGNELSFLHVTRPEIDLPPDADPHGQQVHAAGRAALNRLLATGTLVLDDEPGLLCYRLSHDAGECFGVVGCATVADFEAGRIAMHEHTRPDKEADRADHLDAAGAHVEPVMLMYRDGAPADAIAEGVASAVAAAGDPVADVVDGNGARHTLWRVPAAVTAQLVASFDRLPRLYVADGHHRTAAAAVVARRRAGTGDSDRFPVVAFPADRLTVLGYHRLVADLGGRTPEELLAGLADTFEVHPSSGPVQPAAPGTFGVHVDGRWYEARLRDDVDLPDGPVARLDVSLLQDLALGPLLGIGDPRTDERLGFVGGSRGASEVARLVTSGTWAVGFSLHPTSVAQVMDVSDAGATMPPKSTWFHPKLASGLFVHLLEG